MLDAMTLDQIRTFVTVADSGSFRSGAARLLRVQSAVSHAIANLEAELELQLFDRSGYRPVLTPEGEALLAHARDILLRADAMRARARALGAGVELELALVVDTLFPIESVARAVAAASAEFPSTCFRVDVQALGGPIAALEDRRCALAIIVGEDFRNPRLSLEAIGSVQQVAVVCATHPLAAREERERLGIADLANHLQIVLTDPTPLSEGRSFGVLSPLHLPGQHSGCQAGADTRGPRLGATADMAGAERSGFGPPGARPHSRPRAQQRGAVRSLPGAPPGRAAGPCCPGIPSRTPRTLTQLNLSLMPRAVIQSERCSRSSTDHISCRWPCCVMVRPAWRFGLAYIAPITTVRMSSANCLTRASLVSQEHMKRAPPTPMKV